MIGKDPDIFQFAAWKTIWVCLYPLRMSVIPLAGIPLDFDLSCSLWLNNPYIPILAIKSVKNCILNCVQPLASNSRKYVKNTYAQKSITWT